MRKRCLLTLFAAIIWLTLVQAETRIEVDENGDEYELKRFHIQGRQLNGSGSKSQCVVTRRKRQSRGMALPGQAGQVGVTVNSQQIQLSPEHRETVLVDPENGKRRYVALAAVQLEAEAEDDDDEEEEEEEEEEESEANAAAATQQAQKLPAQTNLVAATFGLPASLPQGVSVVANAATHTNVVGDAGIVVVESEQPPKVNPSTHAVFELKPLKPQQPQRLQSYWPLSEVDEEDEDEDEDLENEYFFYGDDGANFYDEHEQFITSDSPVSTMAIWSSDNDDIHPVINEANQPLGGNKKKKQMKKRRRRPEQEPSKRKTQKQRRKQQKEQQQQLSSANKRKPSSGASSSSSSSSISGASSSSGSSSGSSSSSATSTVNKRRRPSQTNANKRQKQPSRRGQSASNSNKRRRPASSSGSSSGSSSSSGSRPVGGYKRRRPTTQTQSQRRRQQQQREKRRREQELQRRRRRRNRNRNRLNGNGGNRRQYYESEPIINCIYINKDPVTTTTTARPFWNLLGRDAAAKGTDTPAGSAAGGDSQVPRNADFGHRKRTNLRFVA